MTSLTYSSAVATGRVRLASVRRSALAIAHLRVLVVLVLFALAGFVALLRIAQLGTFDASPQSDNLAAALVPPRAEITDRNGVPLARAFPAYSLWFNPDALGGGTALVKSPREVARALVRIFPDLREDEIYRRLTSGKPSYLRRRVLPEQANQVHALGEPGMEFPRETDRYYPQGSLGAHVLGFVAADGHGRVGMEETLDSRLVDPEQRDHPVALSIDSRVQGALEDELYRGITETRAIGAAGVILDVDTGEIVALASLPTFNPNRVDNDGAKHIFNRVTNQVYELGSTFKPLAVASAIDAGVLPSMAERFSAAPFRVGRFTIKDSHGMGASLNTPEALIHSSNIVTAQIAQRLGPQRLKTTMEKLGMNRRPEIELPAKGFPLWPRGDDNGVWAMITTMTVSYGHGIAVTPLHLASAYAALVNGGIWRPATLMKRDPSQIPEGRRVYTESTSARMRQLLRLIVDVGTGKKANAPGYRVGGKTGSAEKPGAGGYRKTSLVATFAAAFPMDKPRYVVIAMLDEPQGTAATSGQRTAAWNAAPIVGRVVPRIGPLLGVMPDENRDVDISDLAPLVPNGDGE